MKKIRLLAVLVLTCCLVFSSLHRVLAGSYDLGSAGLPTIGGNVGGSVTGTSTLLSALSVTVNFGELSPANPNQLVTVVIPIALRSDSEYQVTVTRVGTVGVDLNSVQFSDIGFGIQNLRRYGNAASNCGGASTIRSPFNNNPSSSFTINGATGRAQYPSSLANIGLLTVILSGPQLSDDFNGSGQNDGWAFDAILAVKPQYYTPGTFGSITLIFVISQGPAFQCSG